MTHTIFQEDELGSAYISNVHTQIDQLESILEERAPQRPGRSLRLSNHGLRVSHRKTP